jgi:DNA-binding GntR family transcriptional regulator
MADRPAEASAGQPLATSAQARVAEELRSAIISGELAPKSQVSEAALAAAHGTSRTPIREALKQLETEGLVRIVPRVGTFVTEPSWADIVELSQVKEMLDGLAARLVAQRGDPSVLTTLERVLENAEKSMDTGDFDRFAQLVRDFNDAIMIGSGNRKLLQFHRTLMNQMAYGRLLYSSLRQSGRVAACQEEHRAIVRAITARDPDAAEYATRQHVTQSHRALSRSMLSDGSLQGAPADASASADVRGRS